MKNLLFSAFLLMLFSCASKPKDLQPIIESEFKDAKSVYYPSTDYKVASIIVDKNGNVWYLRMNALGNIRDKIQLFNTKEYCQ